MADTATKVPLATTTLSATADTISFSSISGSYTDLILVLSPMANAGNYDVGIRFNDDTAGNYSLTSIVFNADNNANPYSTRESNISAIKAYTNIATAQPYPVIFHILNYSNTTTYKTALTQTARETYAVSRNVGLWRNTNAITSVSLSFFGGGSTSFKSGTTATLYGIL